MSISDETLCAFMDDELSEARKAEVEAALRDDPDLGRRLEALLAGDMLGQGEFDAMLSLDAPGLDRLTAAIEAAPEPAANSPAPPRTPRSAFAASVAGALVAGGLGGYLAAPGQAGDGAPARGWLADIADYHAVYAKQVRHLVEVPASEADHIEVWLSNTVGAQVRIPDLAAHALTFEGARLLVAAGKPVAQLIYTDAEARVVALCLIATPVPREGVETRTLDALQMVVWGGRDANFVIVGDAGRGDLEAIARSAASDV